MFFKHSSIHQNKIGITWENCISDCSEEMRDESFPVLHLYNSVLSGEWLTLNEKVGRQTDSIHHSLLQPACAELHSY